MSQPTQHYKAIIIQLKNKLKKMSLDANRFYFFLKKAFFKIEIPIKQ